MPSEYGGVPLMVVHLACAAGGYGQRLLRLRSDLLAHRIVEMPVERGRGRNMGTPRSGG